MMTKGCVGNQRNVISVLYRYMNLERPQMNIKRVEE